MARFLVKAVNPMEIMLENILAVAESLTFSKEIASKFVGGPKKLETLIAEGKIEATKRQNLQNSKWDCNAAQVLRHCKNMR